MIGADNYFLILGLGDYKPDPNFVDMSIIGTTDEDSAVINKIKATIDTKKLEWSKGTSLDPRNAGKFKHYLELSKNMASDLMSLEIRKQVYDDAKGKVAQLLKRPLGNIVGKGYVYIEELERIAKQSGLTVETVKNFVSVEVREKKAAGELLERPKTASKFKNNDSFLQTYEYADIYAFLCEGTTFTRVSLSSASDWLERAKEKKDSLPAHIKQDIADKKKICEFCITEVFASEDKMKEYNEYLAWKRISDVLQEAKQATAVTKALTKEQGRDFIDDLQSAGAEKSKAIAYLRGFCNAEGIAWESENADKLSSRILCPYCPNMVEATAKICPHCGGEIIVSCPKCKKDHFVGNRFCTTDDCRYDFNNFKRAIVLCEKAKAEIEVLNLQLASVILDEAEELCNSVKEIALLRLEWKKQDERYGVIARKIKDNADKKLFVTAKKDLDSLKSQFPQYSNPSLEEAINLAHSAARDALALAKNEKDDVRVCKSALVAYQNCRDYPGIQELLIKFQPAPVKSITVETDAVKRVNFISWDSAKSEFTTYRLIRKLGSKPISLDDAEKSWEIAANEYTDSEIMPNEAYYYAVASCVGPVTTSLVHCHTPIINLFEVQNISVQNTRASVNARWTSIPKNADIEIWRDISVAPKKPGDGTKVTNVTMNEMADHGLDNDTTYQYRAFVKYRQGNNIVYSNGVAFDGIPTAPPPVIDYVVIKHKRENTFEVEWDADDGVVVSFYLSTELKVEQEQTLEISELNNLAVRANIISKGDNSGEFELPDSNMYFLFPVTQKNTTVVVGAVVPVTSQKLLTISKVQLSGNDVFVKFQWPNEINHVLLLYRSDRYPISVEDKDARRMRVTKAVYDQKSAISVKSPAKGTYFFSLFAELNMSGTTTYSIPDFYTFRYGTLSKIIYDIKKQKWLGKLKNVSIVITPPEDGKIPPLTVIANNGSLPVFRSQGIVVCEVPEQTSNEPVVVDLPIEKLNKNTFLKIFTTNEHDAANYEISLLMTANPCLK